MGLAICRRVVERHGGTITARSAPGQGATFVVTLPAKHLEASGRENGEKKGKTLWFDSGHGREKTKDSQDPAENGAPLGSQGEMGSLPSRTWVLERDKRGVRLTRRAV